MSWWKCISLFMVLVGSLALPQCKEEATDGDADSDSDVDADSDADADSDSDGDGDGDADSDVDADGDADLSTCLDSVEESWDGDYWYCDCFWDDGEAWTDGEPYDSIETCYADVDANVETEIACWEEVYAPHAALLEPLCACQFPLWTDYNECLGEVACEDDEGPELCIDALRDANDACPDFPMEVDQAVGAAFNICMGWE